MFDEEQIEYLLGILEVKRDDVNDGITWTTLSKPIELALIDSIVTEVKAIPTEPGER